MKKTMLKKLKLGICTFDDVHFAETDAKRTHKLYLDFYQIIDSQLLNCQWSESCGTTNILQSWENMFRQPCVTQILSERFNIPFLHMEIITTSSYFLQLFSSILGTYKGSHPSAITNNTLRSNLDNFIHKSWQIIGKIVQCFGHSGNLNLLLRNSSLWMVMFNFVCNRFATANLLNNRQTTLKLECSFPFSWLVYDHLQQLAKINRNLGNTFFEAL